jgi:hypothetical protein
MLSAPPFVHASSRDPLTALVAYSRPTTLTYWYHGRIQKRRQKPHLCLYVFTPMLSLTPACHQVHMDPPPPRDVNTLGLSPPFTGREHVLLMEINRLTAGWMAAQQRVEDCQERCIAEEHLAQQVSPALSEEYHLRLHEARDRETAARAPARLAALRQEQAREDVSTQRLPTPAVYEDTAEDLEIKGHLQALLETDSDSN